MLIMLLMLNPIAPPYGESPIRFEISNVAEVAPTYCLWDMALSEKPHVP